MPLELQGIAEAYAELEVYTQSQGAKLGQNDLWIAATAKVTGATLLTTDRDFDSLDGVHIHRIWLDPQSVYPPLP